MNEEKNISDLEKVPKNLSDLKKAPKVEYLLYKTILDLLDGFVCVLIGALILLIASLPILIVASCICSIHIPERVYASTYTFAVADVATNTSVNDYNVGDDINCIKNYDASQNVFFRIYAVYNDNGKTVRYGEAKAKRYSEFTDKCMRSIKNKQECRNMMEHNKTFACKYKFGNEMTIYIPDDEYDAIMDKLSNGETKVKGGSLN